MKRLQEQAADEGWSVQVYSGDRRLVCSLYPSHGWIFLAGLLLGMGLAASWGHRPLVPQDQAPIAAPKTPPLQVD